MAHFYISSVRAKAFKNISSQWVEVQFRQGLNAVVGECFWGSDQRVMPV